jgi:hypothetical protein
VGGGAALVVGGVVVAVRRTPLGASPPAGLRYVTARPAYLTPGTTYYARASLQFPMSIFVSAEAVQTRLASMGFSNIVATTDSAALPAWWPLSERAGNLFVEATYTGAAGVPLTVPSQVAAIWTT